jgi:hypothetical protein
MRNWWKLRIASLPDLIFTENNEKKNKLHVFFRR